MTDLPPTLATTLPVNGTVWPVSSFAETVAVVDLIEDDFGSAEGLVESGVYAASVTASIIMVSNSMGVSFPSRR